MRLRVVVAEAWRSLTASLSTTLAAALTVLIGMFLVGLLIGLGTWARSWAEHAKSQLDVNVYLCTSTTCDHEVSGSRFPVGSSASRSGGWFTKARASDTRCCSPPERLSG